MKPDYDYCQALMRERDRERFLSALFAPADKRPHLFALYAFDLEIAHVPDAVNEPMAGEIRFQWWREAIAGERSEEAKANPVAAALLDTRMKYDLSSTSLIETIDARQFDLLGQPMESREALDVYLAATAGRSVECAARILGAVGDSVAAAMIAGKLIGLTRLLRNFPRDISKGRLFVPLDLLAAHEVHTASVFGGESSGNLLGALMELARSARADLTKLRSLQASRDILPAILPATLTPLYLARMEKPGYDPFRSDLSLSALRTQFALWRAARSGRV
jgi:phytoene synthase